MARHRSPRSDRTPDAPKGQPSGVRELLRMLIEDARVRIRQDKASKYAPPAVPAAVQRLYQAHQRHWDHIKAINGHLRTHGYQVQTYKPYALVLTGSPEADHSNVFEATRQKRLAEVRRLHQQALLDMLTLRGSDAKAYLERLRTALDAV